MISTSALAMLVHRVSSMVLIETDTCTATRLVALGSSVGNGVGTFGDVLGFGVAVGTAEGVRT